MTIKGLQTVRRYRVVFSPEETVRIKAAGLYPLATCRYGNRDNVPMLEIHATRSELQRHQMADPKHGLDSRPVKWPPPSEVLGFWESGFSDDYTVVVALVRAPNEREAAKVVAEAWSPGVGEWRFNREHDASKPPGDRFPPCEWSVERGTWPWPVTT